MSLSKADYSSAASHELQSKRLSCHGYTWWNYRRSFEEISSFKKWCKHGRLFRILRKIHLDEFPWKCCCFSRWEIRPLQSACWLDSLLDYSQTAKCAKVHVISKGYRGIHRPPVTKRFTQNFLYQWANVLPKFSIFEFACRRHMEVAFAIQVRGKFYTLKSSASPSNYVA